MGDAMNKIIIAAAIAVILAGAADAVTLQYDYAPQSGITFAVSLKLVIGDTPNNGGLYDIMTATGTIDGNAVTLLPNPNSPDTFTYQGFIYNDEVTFLGGEYFIDDAGLVFSTSAGLYNVGGQYDADPRSGFVFFQKTPADKITAGFGTYSLVPIASAPLPEPATWAMMVVGFGLIGATMRRRHTTVSFA